MADQPGLLSNVFNFVSREVETFIANATGAPTPQVEGSSSQEQRVRRRKKKAGSDQRRRGDSTTSKPRSAVSQRRSASAASTSTSDIASKQRALKPRASSSDAEDEASISGTGRAPPANGRRRATHMYEKPTVLKPSDPSGSLSNIPTDEVGGRKRVKPKPQKDSVSVLSGPNRPPTPVSHSQASSSKPQSGDIREEPSTPHPSIAKHNAISRLTMPGSLFPRSPSLAPDSAETPPRPPEALRTTSAASLSAKPSAAVQPHNLQVENPDHLSVTTHNSSQDDPINQSRFTAAEKGKGRAESLYPDLGQEVSFSTQVRGKERELTAALEGHKRNEQRLDEDNMNISAREEMARDKIRIRMLEDEIAKLKQELSRRPANGTFFPPPPPPPPPPPGPGESSRRLPTAGEVASFATVRASLKHAPPPIEAPINPRLGGAKRPGQPTVGIPAEKMKDFLNEMKNKRLRKVSSVGSGSGNSSYSSAGDRSFSLSDISLRDTSSLLSRSRQSVSFSGDLSNTSMTGLPVNTSWTRKESGTVGEKRKRFDGLRQEESFRGDPTASAKRRSPHLAVPSNSRPTSISISTPSLTSDDAERDRTTPPDDRLPSTPPPPVLESTPAPRVKATSWILDDEDVIDVDMELQGDGKSTSKNRPPTPYRSLQKEDDIFSKRQPSSPLPPSPMRPRPPAKTSRKPVVEGSDDELMLSPPRKTHSRRRTLDEEIQDSFDDDFNLESGVFTGVGTKSKKKGFLARGGAGGSPVFMDVGYVEGVEEDDERENEAAGHRSFNLDHARTLRGRPSRSHLR